MNECSQALSGIGRLVHPPSGTAENGQGRALVRSFQLDRFPLPCSFSWSVGPPLDTVSIRTVERETGAFHIRPVCRSNQPFVCSFPAPALPPDKRPRYFRSGFLSTMGRQNWTQSLQVDKMRPVSLGSSLLRSSEALTSTYSAVQAVV